MGSTGMRRARFMMAQANANKLIKYGFLYNWYATQGTGNSSLIPQAMVTDGWGFLNNTNANVLYSYLSASTIKIQDTNLAYWSSILAQTNQYNFNARGNGFRESNGVYDSIKQAAGTWSYDSVDSNNSWIWVFGNITNNNITATSKTKNTGCSIRLVRTATTQEQLQADGTVTQNGYTGNDGQKYSITKIGTQMWLACNLAETKFRDGSTIPTITDNTAWANNTGAAKCAYNNDETNVFI